MRRHAAGFMAVALIACGMLMLCACDNNASSQAAGSPNAGEKAPAAPHQTASGAETSPTTGEPKPTPKSPASTVTGAATVASAGPFKFADDELGRWLEERLSPPRYTPADPVPFVDDVARTQATPAQLAPAIDLRTWMTSPVALSPVVIVPAEVAAAPPPPARLPPLASAGGAPVHMQTTFAVGALTFVIAPPVDRPLPLPTLALPTERPTLVSDNPTAAAVRELSLTSVTSSPGPAPANVAAAVADPFAAAREIRLTNVVSDVDAPAASFDVPRAPAFDVAEPASK